MELEILFKILLGTKFAAFSLGSFPLLSAGIASESRGLHSLYLGHEIYHAKPSHKKLATQQLQELSRDELDRDWHLSEFFGHIKIIGSKDSSRYPQLLEKLGEVGLTEEQFEFSPEVDGTSLDESLWSRVSWRHKLPEAKQGVAGCVMAHYCLLKETRDKYHEALQAYEALQKQPLPSEDELIVAKKQVEKYSSVLIMEDNCAFGVLQYGISVLDGKGTKFREALKQLPEDWDMFYFICMHKDFGLPPAQEVDESPLLLKAVFGLSHKCFAVKASIYDQLIEQYEFYIYPEKFFRPGTNPELISQHELPPADHITARMHKRVNAYVMKESLAYRVASPSMVNSDSPTLSEQHWQCHPY